MQSGSNDYRERDDTSRRSGGAYDARDERSRDERARDERWRDERARDERWRDEDRRQDSVRNSPRSEQEDNYPDDGRGGRGGIDRSSRFPDRSRSVRGERYGLTDWSPGERADGYRDRVPEGMGWNRNAGDVGGESRYNSDNVGRAAYHRDQLGRDDYGAYGQAVNRGDESHAGKGPKGWQRSDDRIREDVSEALARHPALDATNIEVEVDGGEVKLSGTVADRSTKRMAEDVAEGIFSVRDVQNHLRIERDGQSGGAGDTSRMSAAGAEGRNKSKGNTQGNASPSPTTATK